MIDWTDYLYPNMQRYPYGGGYTPPADPNASALTKPLNLEWDWNSMFEYLRDRGGIQHYTPRPGEPTPPTSGDVLPGRASTFPPVQGFGEDPRPAAPPPPQQGTLGATMANPSGITYPKTDFPEPPTIGLYPPGAFDRPISEYESRLPPLKLNTPQTKAPNTPVPQQAKGRNFDFTQPNQRLDAARPSETQFDKNELYMHMLLGSIANMRGRSSQEILNSMAAGMGQGALRQMDYERGVKRQDQADIRGYEERRAGHDTQQQQLTLGREDQNAQIDFRNAGAVYDDAWRKAQWAQHTEALANDVLYKNYTAATQRLQYLTQLAHGDRDYELKLQMLNDGIARGNWEMTFHHAGAQAQEARAQATLELGIFSRILAASRIGGNNLGGMDDLGFISNLVPHIAEGKATMPGLDIVGLRNEAYAAFQAGIKNKTIPSAAMADTHAQSNFIRDYINQQLTARLMDFAQKNPYAFQHMKQSYGRLLPMGQTGGSGADVYGAMLGGGGF